jgi:hypothetical protein
LIPGGRPRRYVACTTTARTKLQQKWLASGSPKGKRRRSAKVDPGDLIKAAQLAALLRASDPTAQFIVYLCTNRRLDLELMREVYARASALNVEVDFLEQLGLQEFLDTTPRGQWLRQEHLGIEAELLSRSLLESLSKRSLQDYTAEVLLTPAEHIVPTEAAEGPSRSAASESNSPPPRGSIGRWKERTRP